MARVGCEGSKRICSKILVLPVSCWTTRTVVATYLLCLLCSPGIASASFSFREDGKMQSRKRALLSRTTNPTNLSLGNCQGNCRGKDFLCQHNLSCFERVDRESVPGCPGRGARRVDYCYQPPPGVLVYVGDRDPTTGTINPPDAIFPLGLCQGSCSSNDDCQVGLECYAAVGRAIVPGCNSTGIKGKSYCFDQSAQGPPKEAQATSPPPTNVIPATPVPTISGPGTGTPNSPTMISSTPAPSTPAPSTPAPTTPAPTTPAPTSEPTTSPTASPTQTQSPTTPPELYTKGGVAPVLSLGECEGDCNEDDVLCQYGLTCFARSAMEPVPGCLGTGLSGSGYCHKPVDNTTLVFMGEDGYQEDENGENVFPLAVCQGDCDDDWDCETGLRCFFRDAFEEVPGCVGRGVHGRDYCYKPLEGDKLHVHSPEEAAAKVATRVDSGGSDGLSQAAVISIIIICVVAANIFLCICCKWLLSRDPTKPTKRTSRDESSEELIRKATPAPPLEADSGAPIKSAKPGGSLNNSESKRATKRVNFAESIRDFGQLKKHDDDEEGQRT